MGRYVYIVKSAFITECGESTYMLSTPLDQKDAIQYCAATFKKKDSLRNDGESPRIRIEPEADDDDSPRNRVVELFISEAEFKSFRLTYPDTYYTYDIIERFYAINTRYQTHGYGFMPPAKEKIAPKGENLQINIIPPR